MKIVSWNVNGIAACRRKGFLEFLADAKPDIVCCQEIKTRCSLNTPGYTQFWNLSKKTKCSGTLTLVRKLPLSCSLKMGIDKFDDDGRFIALEYKECYIINVYVPSVHPHNTPDRPDYRMEWDTALREYVSNLSKPVILCGDFNATRAWIDSYPENAKNVPDNLFFVQTYGREWKSSSILGLSMYSVNYIHSRKGRTPGGDPKIRTVRIIVEPVWTISFYPVSCFRPFRASSFTRTSSVPIIALSR